MPGFTCGDHVYLKDNDDSPKNHNGIFVMNQEPNFNITPPITSPVGLLEEKLKALPKIYF